MGFILDARGGTRAWHSQGRRAALVTLAVVLSLAAGCGQRADDKKTGSTRAAKRSQPASTHTDQAAATKSRAKEPPTGSRSSVKPAASRSEPSARKSSGSRNRVLLTKRGCIQLEPHWSSLTVGESIEWSSDLSTPLRVHVSPGVFDRTTFVVNPGATVSSGPARQSGSYSIWTEPGSCQGVPRGVHGSGPGMTVDALSPR